MAVYAPQQNCCRRSHAVTTNTRPPTLRRVAPQLLLQLPLLYEDAARSRGVHGMVTGFDAAASSRPRASNAVSDAEWIAPSVQRGKMCSLIKQHTAEHLV